jgi:capsular exopolysaccharide synthesis family protein
MIWTGEAPPPMPAYVHPGAYSTAAPPLPPAMAQSFDFWGLLKALKRHWVLALTLSLICPPIAAAIAWKLMPPPRFTATAQIRVKSAPPSLMEGNEFGNINEIKQFQKTQQALIKSYNILIAVVEDPKFSNNLAKKHSDPVTWLENELQITFAGEIMSISLSGESPDQVQAIVNEVTKKYMENHVNKENYKRQEHQDQRKLVFEGYKRTLANKRAELRNLARAAGTDDLDAMRIKQQIAMSLEADVQREHMKAQTERQKAKIQYEMLLQRQNPTPDPAIVAANTEALLSRDQIVSTLQSQIADLENSTSKVRGVVRNPNSEPYSRNTVRQLEDLKRQLQERIARIRPEIQERALQAVLAGGQQDKLASAKENFEYWSQYEAITKRQVDDLAKTSEQTTKDSGELEIRREEIDNLVAITRRFGLQVEQLEAEAKAPPRIVLLNEAPRPKTRDLKRRILASSAAALGTLGLVLFAVSWLEYRVRRVSTTDEVSHGLGLRLVGALPATPGRQRLGLPGQNGLQEANWRSRLNESVNAIRTLMLRQSQLERLQVVMVTSATVGEGKTSLACHLATSLARAGRKTLLLDCDLRNPTAHRVFDLPLEPGLSEILRGTVALEDAPHPIDLGDLRMITAGRCDLQALHVLGLDQMRDILDRLRQHYDFIIVDTPPVLPVADTLLVGQHVDASLFSILRDVSRIPRVHAACERLSALGIRILGAVVAGTPLETHGSEYHYNYAGAPVGSKENA